ncbi:DUF3320 domain-containing protein [Chitinophagaceae bacterium LB-8]|uniref:DUF3320 domain-containing protein n=1 Tax=Paraflavisolibacter caeni TaxID=2982496 RepID=A0A9X2XZC8_9BACT|nr:DUF3320 domain-containing protein [Paraflavisolibacter caeni]MCU7550323.1 DUF3320 domain-containing protein [Paraflavisolibacter caeni]
MQDTILARLETSRKELLDLGLRNPLLNFRPLSTRGVLIVNEKSALVYDVLIGQGKNMTFAPRPEKEKQLEIIPATTPSQEVYDTKLQTPESESVLQHKLLNTYYAARTNIEEQGVNTLFLALGMLHWYESENSSEVRRAPLVLVPVALDRSNARERFRLRYTLEEIGENLSLQAKMKAEFGISIPNMPEEDDFSLESYFDEVASATNHLPRWKVERNEIALGFFSFGKFLIYNDLDVTNWPQENSPLHHHVLKSLFNDGFNEAPPTASEDAHIDRETVADQLFQVVDADSSQLLAMLAVHEGRNMVIQGPPGTGKSQTITNLIANAIGQGKKVLFVAEKMAALEVVKRRLDNANLGEACLELHSHKANKKDLHQELRKVLELGRPALYHLQQEVALLHKLREELNDYSFAINTEIGKSGLTAQKVIGLLLQLSKAISNHQLPRIVFPDIAGLDSAKIQRAEVLADKIQARLKSIGVPSQLLFWGCGLRVMLPHEQDILSELLRSAKEAAEVLRDESKEIAEAIGVKIPVNREESMKLASCAQLLSIKPDLRGLNIRHGAWLHKQAEIQEVLQSGKRLAELHRAYEEIFLPEAWDQDVLEIRQELVAHGSKWYKFMIGSYNNAIKRLKAISKKPIPQETEDKLKWVDDLLEAKRLSNILKDHESLASDLFGLRWQGARSAWEELNSAAIYLVSVHQQLADNIVPKEILDYLDLHQSPAIAADFYKVLLEVLSIHGKIIGEVVSKTAFNESVRFQGKTLLHQPFEYQMQLLSSWAGNISDIHLAISWNNLADIATEEKLLSMTTVAESWPEAKDLLKAALQKTWYEYLLQTVINNNAALRIFERTSHEEVIKQFKRLDALNFQYNRARAALRHWEGMPSADGGGQVTVIRTEFNKKARHLPIRKLMAEAGLAIQAIKPVFMMSPLSIANFLPPGALQFDLVIFDEASQVRPVEALGALLRGKQLVVVGDTKQLPPTSFFDTMNSDWEDEESVTADLPSILGMCDAQGAPQRMLRWHYRSRHESLIQLSNHHFYENKLVVFPCPGSKHNAGLLFHHLKDTVYDRGNTRTNAKEAEIVAEAVLQHARKHPGLSLGVVAFSTAQREAIQDALEISRKNNPDIETFFNSHAHEPFFVKNLENVQGDERDVIFISIGYGRTAEGDVSMSFGPLNNEGGEKRLNVLITRAKLRCEVFTNLTAADLDTSRTKSYGVIALKSFLHYAQHGQLNIPQETGHPADSPFEEVVAQQLSALGYIVRKQVGSQGFYIDLAIVDPENPGRYILGIECDGAAYHSARSARDRDRLRQQVLEAMGWKMHRIWSTDWFRNPDRELKRVVEAIDNAWKATLLDEEDEDEVVAETALIRESISDESASLSAYQLAILPASIATQEIHRHSVGRLANWVEQVVEIESPVHFDEVARRIVEAAGVTRIGPRIKEHIKLAAKFAIGNGRIVQKDEFLWLSDMLQPTLRDRSDLPAASRKLKYIAPEELRLAIEKVIQDAVAISPEAAVPFVARMFGMTRITEDMRNELLQLIEEMVVKKSIQKEGDLLKMQIQ